MNIRPGTAADGATAARLHVTSITEGFLSRLGRGFLTRLYRRIARDEGSFLFVAEDAGSVVGMIAGTDDVRTLYRRFAIRDGIVAGLMAAPKVVLHAGSVLETWRYGGTDDVALPSAELLSVAIEDAARGRGVGRALVGALNDEFGRRGAAAVKVVVGADNQPALRMYEACGYRETATIEVHSGVPSKVLVWSPSRR